jgi:FimV-like protein
MKTRVTSKGFGVLAAAMCMVAWGWAQSSADLKKAIDLYQKTQYRDALAIAESTQPKTAPANALIGQCYYMLGDYKKAGEAFENAISAESKDSLYWDWLGRAYGKRAETSSFLTAPHYAGQARDHFEKAVELDPKNLEAVDDLFEYYLEAPGFLGGGADKAVQLSERVHAIAPAKYHSMQARLAEKQKQIPTAEQHLKQAIEAAPAEVGRLVDLARFLARQGRASESDAAFDRAAQLAPNSAELKFQRARAYIDSGRNTDQARQLLQEYLKSALTPDDPPRADAERLLQKLAKS